MARNLSVCAVGLGIEFGDVDDNLDKIGAALTAGPDAAHACWCFSNCPPRQGRVLDRTATRRGGQRDRSGLGRGDDHQPGMASRRGLQPRGTVPLGTCSGREFWSRSCSPSVAWCSTVYGSVTGPGSWPSTRRSRPRHRVGRSHRHRVGRTHPGPATIRTWPSRT
jgi:hypothetical protein